MVTNSVGVAGKLELLKHRLVGAMDRQVIGPIVMLSPGGLKQRHLLLLSQVNFWFCDCMASVLFDPGSTFSYVSSSFATGLNLPCELLDMPIRVSTPMGESVIVEKV